MDMTRYYDGFKLLDRSNKTLHKFRYVKGVKNTRVEDNATQELVKKTGLPQSNFIVRELIKKGEWTLHPTEEIFK